MPKKTLQNHHIDLWISQPKLINNADLLAQYQSLLTDEEKQRQQRYRFAKDRHNALITRAFVRDVLSYYADIQAADWRFIKGEKDKPEILHPPLPLRFNLSHSDGLIVCAVCLEQDIGVDVESISRDNDILAIAERYFSPSEVQELFSLPKEQQRSRFFDYWTLKESYIKACGLGLAIPLDHFSFHIDPPTAPYQNSHIGISFAPQRKDYPEHWQSWLFYPNADYRIALSIRHAAPKQLRWFQCVPLISHQALTLPWPN